MQSESGATGAGGALRERRLREAVQHVSHYWFPVNQQLLRRVKTGLGDGSYDLDIDFLISEIKTDFSLFAYCVREVALRAKKEGLSSPEDLSPVEMLRRAGLARIREVLQVDERRISAHAFESSSELQMVRIREAMISASTAETLAQASKIDPALGFSSGLLRQLGMTLIAWNYPTVYRRVAAALKGGTAKSLDEALSDTLGFSPELLASALAREWKLPNVVSSLLGAGAVEDAQIQAVGATLRKLCEVGEALARANNPEVYPSASVDWAQARVEIEKRLGFEGIRQIQARVAENCQGYRAALPELFKQVDELDAEAKLHDVQEENVLATNPFIKGVTAVTRKELKDLYAEIQRGVVSKETVRRLVKEIIPLANFTGGVIYTADPTSGTLVPRTKIGKVDLREGGALTLRDDAAGHDPVRAAFRCNAPVVESGYGTAGELLVFAGVLGEKQRIGVLYLECPLDELDEKHELALTTFKALRQTLNDCLGLS